MISLRDRGHFTPESQVLAGLERTRCALLAEIVSAGEDDYIYYKDVVRASLPVGDCPHAYEAALNAAYTSVKAELGPISGWEWGWPGTCKKWLFRANGFNVD